MAKLYNSKYIKIINDVLELPHLGVYTIDEPRTGLIRTKYKGLAIKALKYRIKQMGLSTKLYAFEYNDSIYVINLS